jgi:hypothetical protein
MKIRKSGLLVFVWLFCMVLAGAAAAEEKINGTVTSIDLPTKSVVVTAHGGQQVTIFISDTDTASLAKLKDKRIKVGDDIKVTYVIKDGKNVATYFKKPAGC